MPEFNRNVVIVFLVIVLLWLIIRSMYPSKGKSTESFNADGTEFPPVGCPRYGLRGDKLRSSDIANWYIRPDRQIRLNHSSGEMWQANRTPTQDGIKGCYKVRCPINDEYDSLDTCWKCGSDCLQKMKIPDIHPHVPV